MNRGIYSSGSSGEESARAVTRIGRLLQDTEQRVEDARRLGDRLATIRQTRTSRDRAVTVTVDVSGRLIDLRLRDAVAHMSPAALASTILTCVNKAHESARKRASALASEVWGEDSDLTQRMRQSYTPPPDDAGEIRNRHAPQNDRYASGMIIGPDWWPGSSRNK